MTLPQYASKYKQSRFLPQRERKTQRKREEIEVDIMTVLADRDEGVYVEPIPTRAKRAVFCDFVQSCRLILQKKK